MNKKQAEKIIDEYNSLIKRIEEVASLYIETLYGLPVKEEYRIESMELENGKLSIRSLEEYSTKDPYKVKDRHWNNIIDLTYLEIPIEWLDEKDLKHFFEEMKIEKVKIKEENEKREKALQEKEVEKKEIEILKKLSEKYPNWRKEDA